MNFFCKPPFVKTLFKIGLYGFLVLLWFISGQVAQLVEHMTENHGVGSSILPLAMTMEPPEGWGGEEARGP